ncbi:hypothetical protein MUK42_33994 [Musa troglodytarum]|uniref:Uncharacterized protein n=1 Tax=Musa troglodytarum TaxID=320322 RepID=A0A9E7GIW2_9LILI|nr:hypothetical protein MUK42_33994 [Musa troglodytarum]
MSRSNESVPLSYSKLLGISQNRKQLVNTYAETQLPSATVLFRSELADVHRKLRKILSESHQKLIHPPNPKW